MNGTTPDGSSNDASNPSAEISAVRALITLVSSVLAARASSLPASLPDVCSAMSTSFTLRCCCLGPAGLVPPRTRGVPAPSFDWLLSRLCRRSMVLNRTGHQAERGVGVQPRHLLSRPIVLRTVTEKKKMFCRLPHGTLAGRSGYSRAPWASAIHADRLGALSSGREERREGQEVSGSARVLILPPGAPHGRCHPGHGCVPTGRPGAGPS